MSLSKYDIEKIVHEVAIMLDNFSRGEMRVVRGRFIARTKPLSCADCGQRLPFLTDEFYLLTGSKPLCSSCISAIERGEKSRLPDRYELSTNPRL